MQTEIERELDTDELAALLKRTRTTLEIWRQKGQGPVFKRYPNRAIRYRMSDVKAWMEAAPVLRSTSAQASASQRSA